MSNKIIHIALFGLSEEGLQLIENIKGSQFQITKILPPHPKKLPQKLASLASYDLQDILQDANIDVVIELQQNPSAAFHVVSQALIQGKPVIATNIQMLSRNLDELLEIQEETATPFSYATSVSSALPVLGTLNGIFARNYIRSVQTFFPSAANGDELFARLSVISRHAFGNQIKPAQFIRYRNHFVQADELAFLAQNEKSVKVINTIVEHKGFSFGWSLPQFTEEKHPLNSTKAYEEALLIDSPEHGSQFLLGPSSPADRGYALLKEVKWILSEKQVPSRAKQTTSTQAPPLWLEVFLRLPAGQVNLKSSSHVAAHWVHGWILFDDLKEQIRQFEEEKIAIISTGRYRFDEETIESEWQKENTTVEDNDFSFIEATSYQLNFI